MAVIETRYSIGEVVFLACTTRTTKQHPCPDCKDTRRWQAISPAGFGYLFACPRCSVSYSRWDDLSLKYQAAAPYVRQLTIGSVQYNSEPGSYDHGARYMCRETGVGSGSVYKEADLFTTEEEARKESERRAAHENSTDTFIVERFNKTLELSDYQLESGLMELAKRERSRAGELLWYMNDLFAEIAEAENKDAILELVDDYKNRRWPADCAASPKPEGVSA